MWSLQFSNITKETVRIASRETDDNIESADNSVKYAKSLFGRKPKELEYVVPRASARSAKSSDGVFSTPISGNKFTPLPNQGLDDSAASGSGGRTESTSVGSDNSCIVVNQGYEEKEELTKQLKDMLIAGPRESTTGSSIKTEEPHSGASVSTPGVIGDSKPDWDRIVPCKKYLLPDGTESQYYHRYMAYSKLYLDMNNEYQDILGNTINDRIASGNGRSVYKDLYKLPTKQYEFLKKYEAAFVPAAVNYRNFRETAVCVVRLALTSNPNRIELMYTLGVYGQILEMTIETEKNDGTSPGPAAGQGNTETTVQGTVGEGENMDTGNTAGGTGGNDGDDPNRRDETHKDKDVPVAKPTEKDDSESSSVDPTEELEKEMRALGETPEGGDRPMDTLEVPEAKTENDTDKRSVDRHSSNDEEDKPAEADGTGTSTEAPTDDDESRLVEGPQGRQVQRKYSIFSTSHKRKLPPQHRYFDIPKSPFSQSSIKTGDPGYAEVAKVTTVKDSRPVSETKMPVRTGPNGASWDSAYFGRRRLCAELNAIRGQIKRPMGVPVRPCYTIIWCRAGVAIGIYDKMMQFNVSVADVMANHRVPKVVQFGHGL